MGIHFDANMVVRDADDGDLTTDYLSEAFTFGRMVKPVWLAVIVPELVADTKLDISIQINTTGSTYVDYIKYPQITTLPSDPIYIPLLLPYGFQDKAVKVKLDCTDEAGADGATSDFGAVLAGWVLKPHYNL